MVEATPSVSTLRISVPAWRIAVATVIRDADSLPVVDRCEYLAALARGLANGFGELTEHLSVERCDEAFSGRKPQVNRQVALQSIRTHLEVMAAQATILQDAFDTARSFSLDPIPPLLVSSAGARGGVEV